MIIHPECPGFLILLFVFSFVKANLNTFKPEEKLSPQNTVENKFMTDKSSSFDEGVKGVKRIAKFQNLTKVNFMVKKRNAKHDCGRHEFAQQIEYSNTFWQKQNMGGKTLFLYNAYYDLRTLNLTGLPTIRILALLDLLPFPCEKLMCQLWFANEVNPVIVKMDDYSSLNPWCHYQLTLNVPAVSRRRPCQAKPRRVNYQPYLLGCKIPVAYQNKVPVSVSVVQKPCQLATNNLKIIYEDSNSRKDFAVCVKGLAFPDLDISVRLIEWIEILGILGVYKIFIYQYAVHPNVSKVLKFYIDKETIEVRPTTLAGGQPNDPHTRQRYLNKNNYLKAMSELIAYQDCFYRNLYKYKYVALLDIDEVILPKDGHNWSQMMDQLVTQAQYQNKKEASYLFKNTLFLDKWRYINGSTPDTDVPNHVHMLKNLYGATMNFNHKLLFDTRSSKTILHHDPLSCLKVPCELVIVDTETAKLNHYRSDCGRGCRDQYSSYVKIKKPIKDTNILTHKSELVDRTTRVLKELGFFPSD